MTADRIEFVVDAVTDLEELAEYIDARNPVECPRGSYARRHPMHARARVS